MICIRAHYILFLPKPANQFVMFSTYGCEYIVAIPLMTVTSYNYIVVIETHGSHVTITVENTTVNKSLQTQVC